MITGPPAHRIGDSRLGEETWNAFKGWKLLYWKWWAESKRIYAGTSARFHFSLLQRGLDVPVDNDRKTHSTDSLFRQKNPNPECFCNSSWKKDFLFHCGWGPSQEDKCWGWFLSIFHWQVATYFLFTLLSHSEDYKKLNAAFCTAGCTHVSSFCIQTYHLQKAAYAWCCWFPCDRAVVLKQLPLSTCSALPLCFF